ncbi:MAG: CrcB family protein [Bdellovibrionales bacterium]
MNLPFALMIGAAGFAGTLARYASGVWVSSSFAAPGLATLTVNVLGSTLIGFLHGYGAGRMDPQIILILTTGFLGGYTTFSAFSLETILFLQEGRWWAAALYVSSMIVLGLLAAYSGLIVSRSLFPT